MFPDMCFPDTNWPDLEELKPGHMADVQSFRHIFDSIKVLALQTTSISCDILFYKQGEHLGYFSGLCSFGLCLQLL